MELVFWLCVLAVLHPYVLFPTILWTCSVIVDATDDRKQPTDYSHSADPFTIIVCAHNEESHIEKKIRDTIPLLETHPQNVMLVVSDHSSDNTVAIATAIGHSQIKVIENKLGRGRALASNFAVGAAKNEWLIFTDVRCYVSKETIAAMLDVLHHNHIGCVNAAIVFAHQPDEVSAAADLYWHFENLLRTAETKLGLYATASGPCMALRRSLFRELPSTGDVDFTTPLDVVDQGYRCAHLSGHFAFDVMPPNAKAEFHARTRMVAKNFSGTISRWGWHNLVRRPLYTWALYSHKILRWLVPFFMVCAFFSNIILINSHWIYNLTFALQGAFYLVAFIGWLSYRNKKSWPIAQRAYAFVLANVAFAFGVLKAAAGRIPAYYVPSNHLKL